MDQQLADEINCGRLRWAISNLITEMWVRWCRTPVEECKNLYGWNVLRDRLIRAHRSAQHLGIFVITDGNTTKRDINVEVCFSSPIRLGKSGSGKSYKYVVKDNAICIKEVE